MTLQIAIVLSILVVAVVLFVSERLRVDTVALLVLVALGITGVVSPAEAVSGFGNPAVITIWAVFILSGALSRTGIASVVGHRVLSLSGSGETRLIAVIMLTAGSLSAIMNNVGVAALLLPVVMDIARRTGRAPSRLLIPLAYACLLGGLSTLIGTPPNLLISQALREADREPFAFFDFTPVGLTVMLAGTAFMALVGRHLLPDRGQGQGATVATDLRRLYNLRERLFVIHVPPLSQLAGKSLIESRLGSLLGLNVIGILREGHTQLAPNPETVLLAGDRLLVEGSIDPLSELRGRPHLEIADEAPEVEDLVAGDVEVAEVRLAEGSSLIGQTLRRFDFRRRFGGNVVAVLRAERMHRSNLADLVFEAGDALLVQGSRTRLDELSGSGDFDLPPEGTVPLESLAERLLVVRIAPDSALVGRTLADSQLGDGFGLTVLGIQRGGITDLAPDPHEELLTGDVLLVEGRREDLQTVEGVLSLEIDPEQVPDLGAIESEEIGLAEVALSPRTSIAGKTLEELRFRERYGLNVIAVSHEGAIRRSNLRDASLRFGDALLLYGPREKLELLSDDSDFLFLTEDVQPRKRLERAPVAALIMASVVAAVIFAGIPIYIAAVAGATLTVLTGCLTMDEAYEAIEWRAVFLIAGMLPLGIALQKTGAATLLTDAIVGAVGAAGGLAIVAVLFIVTALAAQVMPTAAAAILMAPIALHTSTELGLSAEALLMTVAVSASASFMSPVSHPANVLIMGPGGYRFTDYFKVGLPLVIVVLVVVLLVLPVVWPLTP